MATLNVIGAILRDGDEFSIFFPDFPGAGTSGGTVDETIRRGRENLEAHITGLVEAGLELPSLRPWDQVCEEEGVGKNGRLTFGDLELATTTYFPVEVPGDSIRINITIDNGLLARIDRAAAEAGETRSGFLASAARERLKSAA